MTLSLGFGLFSDNVAKEATSRHQTATQNKMHLMAFLGAIGHRIEDSTLSDVPDFLAKVFECVYTAQEFVTTTIMILNQ